jgi:hypothetical protein
MLKNKLVEQILLERYEVTEQVSTTPPPTPPATTAPNTPEDSFFTDVAQHGIDKAVDIAIKAGIGIPALISLVPDIKNFFFGSYRPSKSNSDVLLSKIPSMISPETLKTPRLQRVKDFGSAEGKKIAS